MQRLIILLIIIGTIACSRKSDLYTIHISNVEQIEKVEEVRGSHKDLDSWTSPKKDKPEFHNCTDSEFYVPYDEDSMFFDTKYIRVNFHIMDRSQKDQNFKEGTGEAESYLPKLLENANFRLRENFKMNMPAGNNTPQLIPRYQYVLVGDGAGDDGIYYHYDDEHYYFLNEGRKKNNYSKKVIEKYAVNSGEVLNIFLIPHHPDSVASKKYKEFNSGIALGTDVKLGCIWGAERERHWKYATLLNHEIGHVLSLRHAWIRNDGCDDTPSHKRNWKSAKSFSDGVTTNNVMDYNASQMAFTPCQLGRAHKVMTMESSRQRNLVIPNWCEYDSRNKLEIKREVFFNGEKDLNKDLVIKDGGRLIIKCRLSMAASAKIIVEPGGYLELNNCRIHNSCGDLWGGIEVQNGKKKSGTIAHLGDVRLENVTSSNSLR